ncbi:helix-turn-helix domain-containing protein [Halorhodospira abdelmalekii]|uniref:helix-turn-helix domain-containing protein n=1 Tax=Halorhodospira abdelmalekii TaxID=421629 RepID=UPI001908C5ED|nr:helix-turn-helix domain-containing protein [Halorhodospira abdelmalekii]
MSLDATRWAWSQTLESTEKLVLLALADAVHSHGGNASCWPSVTRLMGLTGLARRTVFKALASLEARALLQRDPGHPGRSTVYRLQIDSHPAAGNRSGASRKASPPPRRYEPPAQSPDFIPADQHGGDQTMQHQPSPEPAAASADNARPKRPSYALSDEQQMRFERFWAIYPRRIAKAEARKAWAQIDPDESLTGRICIAVEAALLCDQWRRERGRFIPHPATWLRREGWEDEYDVAIPGIARCGDDRVQGTVDAIQWLFRESGDAGADIRQCDGVLGSGVQPGDDAREGGCLLGSAALTRG